MYLEKKLATKKTTKRRGRRKKRNYFTEVHEAAIVQYASTDDRKIKDQLYRDFIHPAFDELVDKIVYTYKFTTLPNIDDLKAECKVWLTTILDKFDPDKGSKAFSYFSVTTKKLVYTQSKEKYSTTKKRSSL